MFPSTACHKSYDDVIEEKSRGLQPARCPAGQARLVWLTITIASGPLVFSQLSCDKPKTSTTTQRERPNIIWVVWDTVRADHLSLHGYEKPTTPRLDEWARNARVYENCTSPAPTTTPTHASWFTGLMPSEHGASDKFERRVLNEQLPTIAELFRGAGYQTYLYSANPNISRTFKFTRGFDVEEHPWDKKYLQQAFRIVHGKIPPHDHSSELAAKIRAGQASDWGIKASGELHRKGTLAWLGQRDPQRPFFIFLNYMEAHRPYIPAETYRRRMMTPEQVARSYQIDLSWTRIWSYTFGLSDYSAVDLALTAATYDSTLAELDDLFHNLLAALEAGGHLENTVVVLTADHGEQLGEHHMLDHQYSVYEPLLRVPLVIHYPRRIPAGRDPRPVTSLDLFPTLLELAGIEPPAGLPTDAVSLLDPHDERLRVAEYPAAFDRSFGRVQQAYPRWDPTPWQRSLRALYDGDYKYIRASDGRCELYNIRQDPRELSNLIGQTELAQRLAAELNNYIADLRRPGESGSFKADLTEDELNRLAGMGYFDLSEDEEEEKTEEGEKTQAPKRGKGDIPIFGP
ncbi:MAG: sulfatase-like hydrolase/transferase [Phycisphaerae bacterium]|nr:sulfatase-like hydrolase/transferase [Phycisphaerae bacterium]